MEGGEPLSHGNFYGEYLKSMALQNFQYAFYMMNFEVEMTFKSLGMLVTGTAFVK